MAHPRIRQSDTQIEFRQSAIYPLFLPKWHFFFSKAQVLEGISLQSISSCWCVYIFLFQVSQALLAFWTFLTTSLTVVLSETLDGNETELSSTVASIALPRETTVIPTETLPLEKSTNGSTGQTTPPRIYLQKGNLKDGYLASKKDNDSYKAVHSNSSNGIQTSIQIYIIFFIGIVPAALGAALWWLQQNIRNICSGSSGKSKNNQADIEKLSHSLMKGDPNKVSIDNLAQQIARRAEKISNGENGALYNSYRSKLIKSRRVYSLEVPRKCLEMIEILGVGNFGEVWKAKTYQVAGKGSPMTVAVKTSKGRLAGREMATFPWLVPLSRIVNANMEQQEELLKELDIMLQLGSHPNVVRLLGCCTENGTTCSDSISIGIHLVTHFLLPPPLLRALLLGTRILGHW